MELTSKNGAVSRFELRINYVCPQLKIVVEPVKTYNFTYDKNSPVPYIHSIDSYGEVKIRFNATMLP